ncbi:MAG: hypothetical protein ACT4QF_13740 [Sporichthyaceae bacterium]
MTTPGHSAAWLAGARLREVTRSRNVAQFDFTRDGADAARAIVQCPWRVVADGRIVLGAADLYADDLEAEGDVFDARARLLNEALAAKEVLVSRVLEAPAGVLTLECTDRLSVQVFPDSSSSIDAWRIASVDGQSDSYPAKVIAG